MGMFDFLKGTRSTVWQELPADLEPHYRLLEEAGLALDSAWAPVDPFLFAPLRGRVDSALGAKLVASILARHAATHALAGVDQDGCARFFDAASTPEVVALASDVLVVAYIENSLGLVRRDDDALAEYAEAAGASHHDSARPLAPMDCEAVTDLAIAGRLGSLMARPLAQEEAPIDLVCEALDVDELPGDLTTYFSLHPQGKLFAPSGPIALVLFGATDAAAAWEARDAGHASYELLPIAMAPPLSIAVDVRGASGPVGAVYACSESHIAPLAPSLAAMMIGLPEVGERLAQMARSLP